MKIDRLLNIAIFALYIIGSYYFFGFLYTFTFEEEASYNAVALKFMIPLGIGGLVILNIIYVGFYYLEIPFIEKYKVNGLEWPWKENPVFFKKILPGAVKTYIFNYFCFNVYLFVLGLWTQPSLSPNALPNLHIYILHIFVSIICEDFFFYWGHRLLHHPFIYSKVHKKHHEFYNIIHISCINTHWFEFLLSNIIPLFSGLLLLGKRMHIISFAGWIFYRILETHECHSGYEFTWSMFNALPFTNDSAYHNFHHLKNIGNYTSFFRFWDTLFGTNKYYFKLRDEMIASANE